MKVKNTKNFIPTMYFFTSENILNEAGLRILSFWVKYLKDNNLDENIHTLTKTILNLEFYECKHDEFNEIISKNSNFPYEIQFKMDYCRYCGLINEVKEIFKKEIYGTIAH